MFVDYFIKASSQLSPLADEISLISALSWLHVSTALSPGEIPLSLKSCNQGS